MQAPDPSHPSEPSPDVPCRIVLIEDRDGADLMRHPDLVPLLADGWHIRRAEPRLVEGEGRCLLVTLVRPGPAMPTSLDGPSTDEVLPRP